MIQVEAFLKENSCTADFLEIRAQFHAFRVKEGLHFGPSSDVYNMEDSPYSVWQWLDNIGLKLAFIAKRLFISLSNSVPSERSFSSTNYLHSRIRNRLEPGHTDMEYFIYMNSWVLDCLAKAKSGSPDSTLDRPDWWESVDNVVLIDLEDSYQSMDNSFTSEIAGEDVDIEDTIVVASQDNICQRGHLTDWPDSQL